MISRPGLRWKTFWWVCDWVVLLVVVVGSLIPSKDLHQVVPDFGDKAAHCAAYFSMAIWFAGSLNPKRYLWLAVCLCALGIAVEGAQYVMELGREADWKDVAANTLGVLSGIGLSAIGLGNWMAWVERRFVRA